MSLSVVIPSRTATNLIPCVDAIWANEDPKLPIIVVDDGLAPDALQQEHFCQWDRKNFPLWVWGEKPFIFSRNVNRGIRKAGSYDVVVCNDDALLQTPGGFTAMQRAAAQHPEYGIIGAVTNIVGNTNQQPQGIGLREDPRMVCFVCVFIPRGTIERVGLLDEEFTGYGFEDDSYCLRVRRAGLKIGIFDGCFVDHGSLRSTFRGDPRTPANLAQNAAIFRQKYGADNWAL